MGKNVLPLTIRDRAVGADAKDVRRLHAVRRCNFGRCGEQSMLRVQCGVVR